MSIENSEFSRAGLGRVEETLVALTARFADISVRKENLDRDSGGLLVDLDAAWTVLRDTDFGGDESYKLSTVLHLQAMIRGEVGLYDQAELVERFDSLKPSEPYLLTGLWADRTPRAGVIADGKPRVEIGDDGSSTPEEPYASASVVVGVSIPQYFRSGESPEIQEVAFTLPSSFDELLVGLPNIEQHLVEQMKRTLVSPGNFAKLNRSFLALTALQKMSGSTIEIPSLEEFGAWLKKREAFDRSTASVHRSRSPSRPGRWGAPRNR